MKLFLNHFISLYLFFIAQFFIITSRENKHISVRNTQNNQTETPTFKESEDCSCNLIKGVCDYHCCCDNFCEEYIEKWKKEGSCIATRPSDPVSYLIPLCGSQQALRDLYNPLYIGVQILKKGLCLMRPKNLTKNLDPVYIDLDDNITEAHRQIKEEYKIDVNRNRDSPYWVKHINLSSNINDVKNYSYSKDKFFQPFKHNNEIFMIPIVSPSGNCLLKAKTLKMFQSEVVTCLINESQKEVIINQNYSNEIKNISINNQEISPKNDFLIKVQFIFKPEEKIEIIHYYYHPNQTENKSNFSNTTFEYLFQTKDGTKSGNPGYIKSKPLLFGKNPEWKTDNDQWVKRYKSPRIFSGVKLDGNCSNTEDFYEDLYLDNIFSFEDGIIYGCKFEQNSTTESMKSAIEKWTILNSFRSENALGRFGSSLNNNLDWLNITMDINNKNLSNEKSYVFGINILFTEKEEENNPQNVILYASMYCEELTDPTNFIFIKINWYKHNSIKKWSYAPGPGFFRLPRNIMYPFKIGTSDYSR